MVNSSAGVMEQSAAKHVIERMPCAEFQKNGSSCVFDYGGLPDDIDVRRL
jgi:hypothetical protein